MFLKLIYIFFIFFTFSQPLILHAGNELLIAIEHKDKFLKSKEEKAKRSKWLVLIKEFEAAALAQYDPRHASKARYFGADLAFKCGEIFKQKEDYQTASNLAKRALLDCPKCTHTPNNHLLYGKALMAQGLLDQAAKELMKVELNFPKSSIVPEARKLMAVLSGAPPPVPQDEDKNNTSSPVPESIVKKTPKTPQAEKKTVSLAPPSKSHTIKAPATPKPRVDGLAQAYGLELIDEGAYITVIAFVDKITPYVYNLIPPSRSGGAFRVYADLKGAVLSPKAKAQVKTKNSLLNLVKMNQFQKDVVRVVMDMPEAHHYRPVFLDKPPRLIFHVAKEASGLPAQVAEAQPEAVSSKAEPFKDKKPLAIHRGNNGSLLIQLGLKIETIVIDPGHGGKDLGTSNANLEEKKIVLALSKKLAAKIKKRLDLKVQFTREEDVFVTLERRTKIATDKSADLFISLHVNANSLPEVEGFETYVLNVATDNSAMAVAARENAESGKSVSELKDLMLILAQNTKIAESRAMAQTVHKSAISAINNKYKVRDLGVKEAPFHVLLGTDVPSILVEIGFITNEKDASRLAQEAYLDAVAEGLCQGLENYLKGF